MARVSEEISKANSTSQGKTDANLANDSNHLGGIPADEYATKAYVQEYHNTKETAQKSYIDQQDQAILNQAKEYTNSQIRNQDFSSFAKVTDVQALDEKLSDEIETGLTAQKNYTDQKTNQIVSDVNANFQEVEGAISTLNGTVNNLFGSVSNGKSQIAGAITDKGVPTSANDSYSTMANNIRAIPSGSGGGGGGETDPNYVNTGDATATASDILLGKTAYAQGEKVYGTLIAQAEEGYPTYGTDTSDATATASDIAYGKTAYARGQLLVGTLNADIEEIYGSSEGDYTIDEMTTCANTTTPDNKEPAKPGKLFALSRDGKYCVRVVQVGTEYYLESFAINSDGLYYQSSANATTSEIQYKKYRYSKEDLGVTYELSAIQDIALGCPGFGGDSKKCVLALLTTIGIKFLTYHLTDNGIIGLAYENETNHINVSCGIRADTDSGYYYHIAPDNNDPLEFICFYLYASSSRNNQIRFDRVRIMSTLTEGQLSYSANVFRGTLLTGESTVNHFVLKITNDNRYAVLYTKGSPTYQITKVYIASLYLTEAPAQPTSVPSSYYASIVDTFNGKLYSIIRNKFK